MLKIKKNNNLKITHTHTYIFSFLQFLKIYVFTIHSSPYRYNKVKYFLLLMTIVSQVSHYRSKKALNVIIS